MSTDSRLSLFSGITILMWGGWGFFGKLALEKRMTPLALLVAEVAISAVCLIPILLILLRQQAASLLSSWNSFGLLSGAGLAVGLLFYYLALERGQAVVVVPLTAAYPVVSVLLSYALLGEKLSAWQWLGVLLVVVGVVLLLSGATTDK